jgi:hypothetical protein
VDLTIEWYRAALALRGPRLYDLSVEQIRRYRQIAETATPDVRRSAQAPSP